MGYIRHFVGADIGNATSAVKEIVVRSAGRRRNQDFQLCLRNRAAVCAGTTRVFVPVAEHSQELHRLVRIASPQLFDDAVDIPELAPNASFDRIDIVQG